MKVMVACSAGGHWVQMRRILPAFEGFERFYVGVEPAADPALGPVRYYGVANVTRKNPQAIAGILRELAASSAPSGPISWSPPGPGRGSWRSPSPSSSAAAGRSGSNSIANTERMSLSGRLARPVADAWLVQWEHLSRPGGPAFWGAVL